MQALAEARRRAVAAGEAARLAREADLKELDELRSRLTEAETRQTRHQWRRENETVTTTPPPIGAAAAVPLRRRESPRDDERSPTRAAGARAAGAAAAGDAARLALDGVKEDRGGGGGGDTLPKDALERAQDLALSLRVEVETLRLEEALRAGTGADVNVAGVGRAPSDAHEEVSTAGVGVSWWVNCLGLAIDRGKSYRVCFDPWRLLHLVEGGYMNGS